jgi:hypothetical protein
MLKHYVQKLTGGKLFSGMISKNFRSSPAPFAAAPGPGASSGRGFSLSVFTFGEKHGSLEKNF